VVPAVPAGRRSNPAKAEHLAAHRLSHLGSARYGGAFLGHRPHNGKAAGMNARRRRSASPTTRSALAVVFDLCARRVRLDRLNARLGVGF